VVSERGSGEGWGGTGGRTRDCEWGGWVGGLVGEGWKGGEEVGGGGRIGERRERVDRGGARSAEWGGEKGGREGGWEGGGGDKNGRGGGYEKGGERREKRAGGGGE